MEFSLKGNSVEVEYEQPKDVDSGYMDTEFDQPGDYVKVREHVDKEFGPQGDSVEIKHEDTMASQWSNMQGIVLD